MTFVDRKKVRNWETQFLRYMKEQKADIRNALAKERKITPDIAAKLDAAIAAFQPLFTG